MTTAKRQATDKQAAAEAVALVELTADTLIQLTAAHPHIIWDNAATAEDVTRFMSACDVLCDGLRVRFDL